MNSKIKGEIDMTDGPIKVNSEIGALKTVT